MQELFEALYPLRYPLKCDTHYIAKKNEFRRVKLIPDLDPNRPKTAGYINLKYDYSGWIPDPDKEGYIIPNPDPNFKTDWNKMERRNTFEKTSNEKGNRIER